ncbi:MAG TPA: hypothetical protein VFN68_07705 [Acidimicrobiales bacterium]|nr:hypothetical protein [Acidimicrobiales bacterium]
MEAPVASLRIAAAHGRPLVDAGARLVEVPAPLAPLFPEGGIRRGTTVAVGPLLGGCSVALSLAGAVTRGGGWVAAVGTPSLGLVAAAELGVDLRRLALVPGPGDQWPTVVAALVDGFDLLLVRPAGRVRAADARRLAARVRERGTVMVLLDPPGWPESPDIRLWAGPSEWEGLGEGHGHLRARRMVVSAGGRRVGGRERRREVWLPSPDGRVAGDPAMAPGQPGADRPAVPVPADAWEVAG